MMVAKLCVVGTDNLYTADLSHLNGANTGNLVLETSNGDSWLPLIIITMIVTIFAVVLLIYTTFGKKIINTGMSTFAAQYVGYHVKFNQILAMSISGAVAGILGMMVYLGNGTTMPIQIAAKSIPQQGFTGISVGLIAMSNP
jgi:simple sugar transport system permease protein